MVAFALIARIYDLQAWKTSGEQSRGDGYPPTKADEPKGCEVTDVSRSMACTERLRQYLAYTKLAVHNGLAPFREVSTLANENHPYEEQLQLNDSALDQSVAKVSERTSGTVSQPSAVPKSASGSGGRTGKSSRQEFFLPVSGFVWLLPEEVAVVDHPAVQRLGRIYQLGQSYVVFRGATHKRLEHVIGALHVVQRMIAAVKTNSEKFVGDPNWGPPLSDSEARFVQLGTLLHDIGHMAAGHTVEDELQLVSKHDADKRLDIVFNGKLWRNRDGQSLGELIDKTYAEYVPSPNSTERSRSMASSVSTRRFWTTEPDGSEFAERLSRRVFRRSGCG